MLNDATIKTDPTRRLDRIDLRIITPLCLTAFVGAVNIMGVGPFLSDMADDLRSSVPLVGQAMTVTMLTAGMIGLLVGPLADRHGHRRALLIGLVAVAISGLLTAAAANYSLFIAARLVGGIGSSMTIGVAFGVAVSSFRGRARLRAVSFIGAALSLATAAGPPLLTTVATVVGWRGAFVLVALLTIPAAALLLTIFQENHLSNGGKFAFHDMLASYLPLIEDRAMLTLYGVWGLRAICWIGPIGYLGAFVTDEHGFSTEVAGIVYFGAGTGYLIGSLLGGGRIGDLNLRIVTALAMAGMGIGWMLVYGLVSNFGIVLACLSLTTILAGISQISLTTLMANESAAGPATTMVLNESLLSFGAALGSLSGGLLLGLGGFVAIGLGLPLAAILGSILIGRQRYLVRATGSPVS